MAEQRSRPQATLPESTFFSRYRRVFVFLDLSRFRHVSRHTHVRIGPVPSQSPTHPGARVNK